MEHQAEYNVVVESHTTGRDVTPRTAEAAPLPCAFCGGTLLGLVHAQTIDGIWTAVVCRRFDCGAQGPWAEHEAYAAERWNTRPASNVTVHVPGIGPVRMPPDDALRMLVEDILTECGSRYINSRKVYMQPMAQRAWDEYAADVRARLAAVGRGA